MGRLTWTPPGLRGSRCTEVEKPSGGGSRKILRAHGAGAGDLEGLLQVTADGEARCLLYSTGCIPCALVASSSTPPPPWRLEDGVALGDGSRDRD